MSSGMVIDRELEKPVREAFEFIFKRSEELGALIEAIQELPSDGDYTRINIGDLIRKCLEALKISIKERNHTIIDEFTINSTDIDCRPNEIYLAIKNVILNACKYNPPGGRIILRAVGEVEQVEIRIIDNGFGVPKLSQEHIFEKGYRASNVSDNKPGKGLGLSLAKHIITKHGGDFSCESPLFHRKFPGMNLGGERMGSQFIITLPVKRPNQD
jgi:signal transduction histidine kinase